ACPQPDGTGDCSGRGRSPGRVPGLPGGLERHRSRLARRRRRAPLTASSLGGSTARKLRASEGFSGQVFGTLPGHLARARCPLTPPLAPCEGKVFEGKVFGT